MARSWEGVSKFPKNYDVLIISSHLRLTNFYNFIIRRNCHIIFFNVYMSHINLMEYVVNLDAK